jgi:hypothetical protein
MVEDFSAQFDPHPRGDSGIMGHPVYTASLSRCYLDFFRFLIRDFPGPQKKR